MIPTETSQTDDQTVEKECSEQSLQKTRANETEFSSRVLQAKCVTLENAQAAIKNKQETIDILSDQLTSLQDIQQQYASLQQECMNKTHALQTLSESQTAFKQHLKDTREAHGREIDSMAGKLHESLVSDASKNSQIEALTAKVIGLELISNKAKTSKEEADLEISNMKEDLALAKEAQHTTQLGMEKALRELAALKDVLVSKDDLLSKLKALQVDQMREDQHRASLEEELQKRKSLEEELMQKLEEEKKKIIVLEDLRRKDSDALALQEISWRDEREKLVIDLSSKRDVLKSQELYAQMLEEKLERAEDAVRSVTEKLEKRHAEISELRAHLQQAQMQLTDADSAIELLEKAKGEEIVTLSDQLHARLRDLEKSQEEVIQHKATISAMAADMRDLQELHQENVSLKEALKSREDDIHALSLSQEKSRLQLKVLEDEYNRKNHDLIVQLQNALECNAGIEKNQEELKHELERLHAAMEKARDFRRDSESETRKLLDELAGLQEKYFILQQKLDDQEESSRKEVESLDESVSRKETKLKKLKQSFVNLECALAHAMQREQQLQDRVSEYEVLSREQEQKGLFFKEQHEQHQERLLQWSEKESMWLREKENLASQACIAADKLAMTEGKLQLAVSEAMDLKSRFKECQQKMITCDGEIAELQWKLDESNAQLQSKIEDLQNLQRQHDSGTSSFTAALQEKNISLLEARRKLGDLESELVRQVNQNIKCMDQLESLEKESHAKQTTLGILEETIADLKQSIEERTEGISDSTKEKEALKETLTSTKEELSLQKSEFELQEKVLKDRISMTERRLQQTLESLQGKERECEALVTSLTDKDSALAELQSLIKILLEENEGLRQSVVGLQKKLEMHALEGSKANEIKEELEARLSASMEEMRLLKTECEMQVQVLKDNIAGYEAKALQTLECMQRKDAEIETLVTCLENKENALHELKTSFNSLSEEKKVLKQSLDAWQSKAEMLNLEADNEKLVSQQLCGLVEEKDRSIASRLEEAKELRHSLSVSELENQKLKQDVERLKGLENNLTEAMASLHDKEERLIASEWAVQQLANEVAKAKGSLAQKEREEVLLQNRFSDLETRLKAKEQDLVDLDTYMQSLMKKGLQKQLEVERLTKAVEMFETRQSEWKAEREGLMSEMIKSGSMLEDKVVELAGLQEHLKQKQQREHMMEQAIQSLKSQLKDQTQVLDEQASKSNLLVLELETAKAKEKSAIGSLNDAEIKLQQANQRFKEETDKLRAIMSETQEKLAAASLREFELERELRAALEEDEAQKGKLCFLSEMVAAKDSSLRDLQHKLNAVQAELEEDKKHINDINEELTNTKERLLCYIHKERELIERIDFLSDEMQAQRVTLSEKLETKAAEFSLKMDEIQQLKINQENMSGEREALSNEVGKIREELNISLRTIQEKTAETKMLEEMVERLEAEVVKERGNLLQQDDVLKSALVELDRAEKNSLALKEKLSSMEGDFTNSVADLRIQTQKAESLTELNHALKAELEEKQELLKAFNVQSKSAHDDFALKLCAYRKKETASEACVHSLFQKMKVALCIQRKHEASALESLLFDLSFTDGRQTCSKNETMRTAISNDEPMEVMENSGCDEMQMDKESDDESQGWKMIPALQMVVQEVQSEEQRRRRIEKSVVEKTRCVLSELAAREEDIEGLHIELDSLKRKEEDWVRWYGEMSRAQGGLEREVRVVESMCNSALITRSDLAGDCTQVSSHAGASTLDEMHQLSDKWRLIVEAQGECTLSILNSIKEELGSSCPRFKEDHSSMFQSGALTEELVKEYHQLKQIIRLHLHNVHHKESKLAEAMQEVERLESRLQEAGKKEMAAEKQVCALQLVLLTSGSALVGSSNNLNASLPTEMISCESASTENGCLNSELRKAVTIAEELHREIESKRQEGGEELLKWKRMAEDASNLNTTLGEQLTQFKLDIRSFELKERFMKQELEEVRVNVKAMEEEATSIRLELRVERELAGHLKLQVHNQQEEFVRAHIDMENLKLKSEVLNESCTGMSVELEMAREQIELLKRQVKDLEEKQVSNQKTVEEWRERASLTCNENQTLQGKLENSRQAIEAVEVENRRLLLELHSWKEKTKLSAEKNNLIRSQLETSLQAIEDLQKNLYSSEKEKQHFQQSCKTLEADLVCAWDASGQQKALFSSALAKVQESSQQNRSMIAARLQALHDAMTREDNNEDKPAVSMQQNDNHDDTAATKIGCEIQFIDCKRSLPVNSSTEGGQMITNPEDGLGHYLELCDSLLRRHARLEKQLQNLVTSGASCQHSDGTSGHAAAEEEAVVGDRKKRVLTKTIASSESPGTGGNRRPLQPLVEMASTPSPCAKRRRSNNGSSKDYGDQNSPP